MWGDTGPQFAEPHLTINQMKQKSSLVGLVVGEFSSISAWYKSLNDRGNYFDWLDKCRVCAKGKIRARKEPL
jgi:hypothetical protein